MRKVLIVLCSLFISSIAFAANETGQQIYQKACVTCHNPNTSPLMKSPQVHDQAAWQARFKAAEAVAKNDPNKETALDVLVNSVKNGKGAMPPGGMCVDPNTSDKKCTDADYKAAIKFMSSAEKK